MFALQFYLKLKKGFFMKRVIITLLLTTLSSFALTLGEVPQEVTLSGENGGLVNNEAWSSTTIKDKVYVLFYVDPDKKKDNKLFIDTLHTKNYDGSKYASIAIINVNATWLPNFAIEKMLKEKQKEFPNTIYVKDKTKYLVKEWGLEDNNSNVVIFNQNGEVIFLHRGEMNGEMVDRATQLIENLIFSTKKIK